MGPAIFQRSHSMGKVMNRALEALESLVILLVTLDSGTI